MSRRRSKEDLVLTSLRMPRELRDWIRKQADKDRRSFAYMIILMLNERMLYEKEKRKTPDLPPPGSVTPA